MDVGLSLMLPGLLGGFCVAALLVWLNRRPSRSRIVSRSALEPLSPDMINMAHIRVAGVGGLGMVAVCVVIAIYLPEIRYSLTIGVGLGAALATTLILLRARTHERASDDRGPWASAMLPLDDRSPSDRSTKGDALRPDRVIAVA